LKYRPHPSMPQSANPAHLSYNFLNIGERGVGKTVFFSACYLECHQDKEQQRLIWFDCEDNEVRQTIDEILIYVAKTGKYPPATLKITNFQFALKQRHQRGSKTIGRVQWWDTPGEICNINNPSFTTILGNTDGFCLFLDVPSLVKMSDSVSALTQFLRPLQEVIELISHQTLDLPLALILTKCDYLPEHPLYWQRLKKSLQPLTLQLGELGVNYQLFYSEIPIAIADGFSTLQLNRVGTPIYWLFSEIHKSRSSDPSVEKTQSSDTDYYIPTPLLGILKPFFGNHPQLNLLNQIPKRRVLLGLMTFMGLMALSAAVILQQTFRTNPSQPLPSSEKSLSQ
jgi:hypothetical protein